MPPNKDLTTSTYLISLLNMFLKPCVIIILRLLALSDKQVSVYELLLWSERICMNLFSMLQSELLVLLCENNPHILNNRIRAFTRAVEFYSLLYTCLYSISSRIYLHIIQEVCCNGTIIIQIYSILYFFLLICFFQLPKLYLNYAFFYI